MIVLKIFVLIQWLLKKEIVKILIINFNITDLLEQEETIFYMVGEMVKLLDFGLIILPNHTFTNYIEMKKEFL